MVDKIRELCKQNGTSIFKLEKQLGFGNGVIGRWDKAVPNYERLSAVASALGVSVSDLTGNEGNKVIVNNIKTLATQRGTNIAAIERELIIGNGTIGKWAKAAKSPPYETLYKIATYFGVSVTDLTGEADEKGIKKGPIPEDEADEMDAGLVAIWNDSDETDRKLLLDMARAIKLRRENK